MENSVDSEQDNNQADHIDVENIEYFTGASATYGKDNNFMDNFDHDTFSKECKENPYYPFASKLEWEFICWISQSHLSMALTNSLLSSSMVSITILIYV